MRKNLLKGAALLALIVAAPLAAQDKHIDVSVEPNGSGYKLRFLNSECSDRPSEMGCIMAEHGTSPNISWRISGAGAGQWVFTRLQFSADGYSWGDPSRPLAECTVEDFALSENDRYSGNASTAQVTANGAMLMIRDRNRNECRTHYRIYAMPVGGGMEIDSDPIIDNRGGGRN